MSANASQQSSQQSTQNNEQYSGQYERHSAIRLLASELNLSKYAFKLDSAERAPRYHLLPSGEKANRVLMTGTITDIENVGESDEPYLKATIVGPTGTFYAYAGKYSKDVRAFLQDADAPLYVIVCGKVKSFMKDEDEGQISGRRVSLNPEWMAKVDADARDAAVLEAAEATLNRLEAETPEDIAGLIESVYGDNGEIQAADLNGEVIKALEDIHVPEAEA